MESEREESALSRAELCFVAGGIGACAGMFGGMVSGLVCERSLVGVAFGMLWSIPGFLAGAAVGLEPGVPRKTLYLVAGITAGLMGALGMLGMSLLGFFFR